LVCFEKMFGFKFEEYYKNYNLVVLIDRMLNNYKNRQGFITQDGYKYWFKNGEQTRREDPK